MSSDRAHDLVTAAQHGDAAAVRLALRSGTHADTADDFGETALRWAATGGHGEVTRALLEGGAWLDKADRAGWTPVMWAASYGESAVLRILLEHGASARGTSNAGKVRSLPQTLCGAPHAPICAACGVRFG
jgi:ankyrin repeat protein